MHLAARVCDWRERRAVRHDPLKAIMKFQVADFILRPLDVARGDRELAERSKGRLLIGSRRLIVGLAVTAVLAVASAVFAQRIWVGGPGRGYGGYPPKWAKPADFD